MSAKKQQEHSEEKLKAARKKLESEIAKAVGEYRKLWTKKKFEEKVEKAARLFVTSKKLKAKAPVKKSPNKPKIAGKAVVKKTVASPTVEKKATVKKKTVTKPS